MSIIYIYIPCSHCCFQLVLDGNELLRNMVIFSVPRPFSIPWSSPGLVTYCYLYCLLFSIITILSAILSVVVVIVIIGVLFATRIPGHVQPIGWPCGTWMHYAMRDVKGRYC